MKESIRNSDSVVTLNNLRRRRLNVTFLRKYWWLYVVLIIWITRMLFVELHQNTCELLRLVFTLCAFFLLLLRFTYNFRTQGYDILYLWTFPDSGAPTSNAASPRNKRFFFKKGLLPVEVRNLAHQVYNALYQRHLHLVGLAPPPKRNEFESDLDLKWSVAPYLLRPQDDNEWRDAIKDLLAICKGVVVECSSFGKNLKWELIEVSKVFPLDRILLVCEKKNRASAANIRQFLISHVSWQSQGKQRRQNLGGKNRRAVGAEPQIIQRTSDDIKENMKMWRAITQWSRPICKSHPEIIKVNQLIFRKRLAIEWPFQICVILTFALWLLKVC